MIKFSAEDIVSQSFETRFRGYDREQVEEFLQVLGREFDHLVTEFKQARQELEAQKKELREYRRREKSLHDALNMAKQVGEQIKAQAERDAELTIADAELKAERMLAGVQNRVTELREEFFDLQQQRVRCQTELRNVLESHMKMLDLLSAPESERGSSIKRAPKPPQAPASADEVDNDVDDALRVSDADIEASEDAEQASATSPATNPAS